MTFFIRLFIVCLLFNFEPGQSQHLKNFDKINLGQQAFFLVTRGTRSKGDFIAQKFNISDKCSTHIGIGIIENGSLKIFNVTNEEKDSPSALVREAIERFINQPDIEYFSIWECRASPEELQELQLLLYDYLKRKVAFDFDFSADDDANMYCSEFCAKILKTLHPDSHYPLTEIKLDPFYSLALERKILLYWPVDFFQSNARFKKIYEVYFDEFGQN